MDYSTPAMSALIDAKEWLVKREVDRVLPRTFSKGGVYDRDDLLQVGRMGVLEAVKYWHPEAHNGVVTPPDGWICKSIQDVLVNFLWSMSRRAACLLDDPESINQTPDRFQDLLPTLDDVDIAFDLSANAKTLLECIFSPPPALRDLIDMRWFSKKPQCKNLIPVLRSWLGWTPETCTMVIEEVREKCQWQCNSDRHAAKKVSTVRFSSSKD